MSSPNSTLRQRAGKEKSKVNGKVDQMENDLKSVLDSVKDSATKDWDYKIAIGIITLLSFVTRFIGISHPNEVVFDEVHFGKVDISATLLTRASRLIPDSSLLTIYKDFTFSMSILPSRNCYSPSWAGSLASTAISSSTILVIPTLITEYHMSPSEPSQPFSVP